MKKLRVYLDSTILITFVFGAKKEPDKYEEVKLLFERDFNLITSIYSLIELYNFPIHNFEHNKRQMAKYGIPHAISAFVERCDYIVTFDSHFNNLDKIIAKTPDELMKIIL